VTIGPAAVLVAWTSLSSLVSSGRCDDHGGRDATSPMILAGCALAVGSTALLLAGRSTALETGHRQG
jgi:hypothetical protein